MRKIDIRIINNSGYDLPEYKTEQSAGCDLVAVLDALAVGMGITDKEQVKMIEG